MRTCNLISREVAVWEALRYYRSARETVRKCREAEDDFGTLAFEGQMEAFRWMVMVLMALPAAGEDDTAKEPNNPLTMYTDSEFAHVMEDAIAAIETLRAESIMHHNAADNYFAEANEYREERNDALTELEQMAACVYYKPGGMCRYGGDDPANMCVLGPCPHNKSAEDVLADLARVTAERDAAIADINAILSQDELCPLLCEWCAWNEDCDGEKAPKWRGIRED